MIHLHIYKYYSTLYVYSTSNYYTEQNLILFCIHILVWFSIS